MAGASRGAVRCMLRVQEDKLGENTAASRGFLCDGCLGFLLWVFYSLGKICCLTDVGWRHWVVVLS